MSIENPNLDFDNPEKQNNLKWRKRAVMASIAVALTLSVVKLIAYLITDTVSILTSLADSMIDILASSITLFSITRAALPPNKSHRYGFDKIESLAAMAQAIFIFGTSFYLLSESIKRLITPVELEQIPVAVLVMVFSILLTLALVVFQYYIIKQTHSVALRADSLNYKGDLAMNAAVIASLVATKLTGIVYVDAVFGVIVSLLMIKNAYGIAQEVFGVLIDKELSEDDRNKIIDIVKAHKEVYAVHDLRTRFSGYKTFIEFHMEVDGKMKLFDAHKITEDVEKEIYEIYPDSDIVIHQEPKGINDYRRDDIIEGAAE